MAGFSCHAGIAAVLLSVITFPGLCLGGKPFADSEFEAETQSLAVFPGGSDGATGPEPKRSRINHRKNFF